MIFAPFRALIISNASEGSNRSFVSRLSNFPMKDFRDTETHIGKENRALSSCSLEIISISRRYHGVSDIRVKKGFFPSALKNPIEGSIIILLSLIPDLLAILRLSFNNFMVRDNFPVAPVSERRPALLLLSYAPIMTGSFDSATRRAILSSYFNPVMSFIQSIPRLTASFATDHLGVSIERGKLQFFFTILIARNILSVSFSMEILFSRYGAVDMAPISAKCAPSCSMLAAVLAMSLALVLMEFL